jgi:hypothetical protein
MYSLVENGEQDFHQKNNKYIKAIAISIYIKK